MKNIILQHYNGDLGELEEFSVQNIQEYAKRMNSDYHLLRGKPFREHLTSPCQKVYMLDKQFDEYDNVLMLDIDMFAPKGMNIDIFSQNGIGLYARVQRGLHKRLVKSYPNLASIDIPYWGGAIYKMNLNTRQLLRKQLGGDESWMEKFNKPYRYEDEGIMHVLAHRGNFNPKYPYLDKKWCQCSFLPNPESAGFIHIRTKITPRGPKRKKIENYNALVESGVI